MNYKNSLPKLAILALSILLVLGAADTAEACYACGSRNGETVCIEGTIDDECTPLTGGCMFGGNGCSGGGGGGCFLPNTTVLTTSGWKPITNIQAGDMVISRTESGETKPVLVGRTYKALALGYYLINGTIGVTEDHPFFVDGDWTNASDLKIGDILVDQEGRQVAMTSKEHINKGVRVFNLDILSPNTFYAGGYLVHNKETPKEQ